MRTGFSFIATLFLAQLAASQLHGHHHRHPKRGVVWVTEVEHATVQAANVVIYVDEKGKPLGTTTINNNAAIPTPVESKAKEPSSPPKPQSPKKEPPSDPKPQPANPGKQPAQPPAKPANPAKPADNANPVKPVNPGPSAQPKKPAPEPSSAPVKKPPTYQAPASSPSQEDSRPAAPGGPDFGSGISYSPYNPDNTCKSASQVANDFRLVRGYSVIRLYGTDCNQVANVIQATRGKGISLFLGVFNINKLQEECETMISAVDGDWSIVNAVSVGNELVNAGAASVGQVTAAIEQVRKTLKAAGYNGPVVTVDTMVAMKNHPELCHASDFCAINCHAFFDGNVLPDGAGDFVQMWSDMVSQAANGKPVVVTETGWPTQGEANNKAVPSKENQAAAIESIRLKRDKNVIVFNAFNDLWKKNRPGTFNAEQFWGIFGDAPSNDG
jgi:exo-beta-1,3-glucanase (GH17 family)